MPLNVFPRISPAELPPIAAPQHFVPPSKRDLRAQAIHRLQFGLFGLCAMLLLVGLANIIMNRAKLADVGHVAAAQGVDNTKQKASDPLADIGVVPAADPSAAAASPNSKVP